MRPILLAALALAAPLAAAQSVPERLADLRLATAVRLALVADPITRPADVLVTAERGRVVLSGDPGSIPDVRRVAEVARDVPGVRSLSGLGAERLRPGDGPATRPTEIETDPRFLGPPVPAPTPAAPPAESSGPLTHVVERGDTLFGLARRYGTTVEAIEALNRLSDRTIRLGQRLRVR